MGIILLIQRSAPVGMRWLGGTIQNTSDTAIYLSYIAQAAKHGLTFINPFAPELQHPRFDLVWSSLGALVRLGMTPLLAYEVARWIFTLVLAFAVFAAARSVARTERDAKLATLLAFLGVGLGALYVAWLGAANMWIGHPFVGPDISSEFAIAPMLLGGPHILLSMALLISAARFMWEACARPESRNAWYAALCLAILFTFHPYYVVLFVILFALSVGANRLYRRPKQLLRVSLVLALCGIPGAIIYLPLLSDPVFLGVHNAANILPLGAWYIWLVSLSPFVCALLWRWRTKTALRPEERWLVAWLGAVVLSLLLPISWKRKLTEGVDIGLVLLTMPAWLALREWVSRATLGRFLWPLMLLMAGLAPLQILLSQLAWISRADRQHWFYTTVSVFDGLEEIRTHASSSAIVTSDDRWLNFWIPAYAERISWLGHDMATTHFEEKTLAWNTLMRTQDPRTAETILQTGGVTDVLATRAESVERFSGLLEPMGWKIVWSETSSTALFEKGSTLPSISASSTIGAHAAFPQSGHQN